MSNHQAAMPAPGWLAMLRATLVRIVPAMLAWELLQLPLYTLWSDGTTREIAFAVLHCTAGDALIVLAALSSSLVLAGEPNWPDQGFGRVLAATLVIGVAYTVYSEWLNVEIRGNWAYAAAMPRLPVFGTGLAPLLQWIVLPPLALLAARRALGGRAGRR